MTESIPVTALQWLSEVNRWRGRVQLPDRIRETDILIFQQEDDFVAIPSNCPHEAVDLSDVPLDEDGCITCPLHGLRVCPRGGGTERFTVRREGEGFLLLFPPRDGISR
ncbi:MAG: Rieske 2Fe-2S domain-containing protein [Sedimenticola sp.]